MGPSPGVPRRTPGGDRGARGSRRRGRAPQGGHGVRSIPGTSCLPWTPLVARRGGGLGGRAQACPPAAHGTRVVPVGKEAVMPKTPEAAGDHRPQAAAETCVGVARHGLAPMALTPGAVGQAAAAVTHGEEPGVRDGDARRRAADRVPARRRAGQGRRGGDDPRVRGERSAQLGQALREEPGAGGACLGPRRAARAAQDGAQGPHRAAEAGSSRDPALPVGGTRASRADAGDRAMGPSGLIPGGYDHGAAALPAEGAVATRHAPLTRRVAQEGPQRSLGREEEGMAGVGHGTPQVARGPRPPRGLAILAPRGRGKGLTRRAGTRTTGMIGVPCDATGGTVCGVPPAVGRPAGGTVAPHLLRRGWHGMGTAGGLPREAEARGAFPRGGIGLASLGLAGPVRGVRPHGGPPAWAGAGPRRAGGRRGGGSSRETAGGSAGTVWGSRVTAGRAASGSSGHRPPLPGGASRNKGAAEGCRGRVCSPRSAWRERRWSAPGRGAWAAGDRGPSSTTARAGSASRRRAVRSAGAWRAAWSAPGALGPARRG